MLKRLPKKKDSEPVEEVEKEMGFLDHLDELRSHIIKALLAVVVVAIGMYMMEDYVFKYVVFGPKSDWFPTYQFFCSLGDKFCFMPPEFDIITGDIGEQFFTSLRVSFWLGLVVAFPYVFYQFWSFIKPGLYDKEKKAARGVVFACSLLFLLGVCFGYFVISPFAIQFLAGYSVGLEVSNTTLLSKYVASITMFTIPTGVVFELPILIYFLSKVGLVTAEFMKTYRRHAFVLILILSAIITPPDVVTQFLIGIPIFVLYEFSILIAARMTKKREKEME